jgi:transposase InsO family protein
MVTPAARRQAVAHLCQNHQMSQRWACEVISVDRSSVRYRSVRPDDAIVRIRLRELAAVRRRFGYRRLLILLRREGLQMNQNSDDFIGRSACRFAAISKSSPAPRMAPGIHRHTARWLPS